LTVVLPRLPDRALLADLCRETAARERVQPQLIEKDFYLTRLLWALGQSFGDALLLKGGTLLSKVDLGFFRMSEDADLVLPGRPSRQRLPNVRRMHRVRDVLREIGPIVGVSARFPAGELFEKATHCVWQLDYPRIRSRMPAGTGGWCPARGWRSNHRHAAPPCLLRTSLIGVTWYFAVRREAKPAASRPASQSIGIATASH
jgi:hypothetical protein